MFESTAIRILIAVIVLILGIVLLKFSMRGKESEFVMAMTPDMIKKDRTVVRKKMAPGMFYATSPIDATIDSNGAWDTNRNSSTFITNVSPEFPVPADSDIVPETNLQWHRLLPTNKTVPNAELLMKTEFAPIPVGDEDPFLGTFGSV
jgi:hypothetical protein